jgi:hypothetical protein
LMLAWPPSIECPRELPVDDEKEDEEEDEE